MPKAHRSVSSVANPIFTVRHRNGVRSLGLFDMFAVISSGDVVYLPALAAYQRPAQGNVHRGARAMPLRLALLPHKVPTKLAIVSDGNPPLPD